MNNDRGFTSAEMLTIYILISSMIFYMIMPMGGCVLCSAKYDQISELNKRVTFVTDFLHEPSTVKSQSLASDHPTSPAKTELPHLSQPMFVYRLLHQHSWLWSHWSFGILNMAVLICLFGFQRILGRYWIATIAFLLAASIASLFSFFAGRHAADLHYSESNVRYTLAHQIWLGDGLIALAGEANASAEDKARADKIRPLLAPLKIELKASEARLAAWE